MTLKTDTEIICLPLPDIVFMLFYLFTGSGTVSVSSFRHFSTQLLSISCFVFIYLSSSIKSSSCSATSSRSPSMTSDAYSLISRIALTTFAPLCNRIPNSICCCCHIQYQWGHISSCNSAFQTSIY